MKKLTIEGKVSWFETMDELADELLEELALEDDLQVALTIDKGEHNFIKEETKLVEHHDGVKEASNGKSSIEDWSKLKEPKVDLKPLPKELWVDYVSKWVEAMASPTNDDKVFESSKIYKEKAKLFHDKKLIPREFKEGDMVLLFNFHLKHFPGKLKSWWDGPFVIKEARRYGAFILLNKKGDDFTMNGHRLKLYHVDTPMEEKKTSVSLSDPPLA